MTNGFGGMNFAPRATNSSNTVHGQVVANNFTIERVESNLVPGQKRILNKSEKPHVSLHRPLVNGKHPGNVVKLHQPKLIGLPG